MKKRILWLGLSFLLVTALVLTSCAETVPGKQEEEEEEEEELLGTIAGTVTDSSDKPIEGATVVVVVAGTELSATTDDNGDYEIDDVLVGIYTVTASAGGYESASQEDVEVSDDATSPVNFTLTLP